MYIENPNMLFACFRCGTLMPDVRHDHGDVYKCGECGEHGLVHIVTALDILNDLFLRGGLPQWEEEEYDYEIKVDDEDN